MKLAIVFKSTLIIFLIVNVQAGWFGWGSDEPEEEVKPEVKKEENLDEQKIKQRVHEHEHKLSEQQHYTDKDNDNKFEHNPEFDREAFLGKDEADKFKTLSPDESREKLGKIFEKMDKNRDKFVSGIELRNWIRFQQRKYLVKSTNKKWRENNSNGDDHLSFDELLENTIGAPVTWTEKEKEENKEDFETYTKMFKRDEKRFKAADHDKDGKLTKKEYTDFLHPEESPAMRDIVIDETLEDLDTNGDGVINIDEFIKDFFNPETGEEEPSWVKDERIHFKEIRDVNKDNVLDREELANWIMPTDLDKSLNEAQHLVHEADENKDGKLTREEILNNYSVFVASTATNYGSDIHEEL